MLECAQLSCDLAFLPDTTYSYCADSQPSARALGWQSTVVVRDSGRTAPCIHTIVGSGRTIESDDEFLHHFLQKHENLVRLYWTAEAFAGGAGLAVCSSQLLLAGRYSE